MLRLILSYRQQQKKVEFEVFTKMSLLSPYLVIPMLQLVIKHRKVSLFVHFLRGVPSALASRADSYPKRTHKDNRHRRRSIPIHSVIRFRVQGRRTRKSGVTSHKRVFNQNQNKTENVNNAGVVSSSGTRLFVFLGAAHSLTAVLTIALSPFPPGLRAFSILSDNHWN